MPKTQTTTADRAADNAVRGARVRAARAYADLSREEVAHALRVSSANVGRMERGECDIRHEDLVALARACEVPLSFMLAGWAPEPATDIDRVLAAIQALRDEVGLRILAENAAAHIFDEDRGAA